MTVCPILSVECRHCSDEYLRLIKDACNVLTHRKVMIKSVEHLGLYCNNHIVGKSGWIREMTVCPATLNPVTTKIVKQMPGKIQSKPVKQKREARAPTGQIKSTAKQLQDKTVRELAKLRSPSPDYLEIPDSSKKGKGMSLVALGLSAKHNPDGTKRKKRVGQQTLGEIIEI